MTKTKFLVGAVAERLNLILVEDKIAVGTKKVVRHQISVMKTKHLLLTLLLALLVPLTATAQSYIYETNGFDDLYRTLRYYPAADRTDSGYL